MTESEWGLLVEGIVRAEYNLLLGAGFSATALDRSGRNLPTAPDLAAELCSAFSLPELTTDLRTAYEASDYSQTLDNKSRDQYLDSRFSDCQPTWHAVITKFNWKCIYSLNIDDVVENAYAEEIKVSQKSVSICWNSEAYNSKDDEIRVIHLHGFSRTPQIKRRSNSNYVFDNKQYANALISKYPWHSIFESDFTRLPFLIVGSQLNYEFDLEEAISQGSASYDLSGRPSFLVVKTINQNKRMILERKGIITIESDAEKFFLELLSRFNNYKSKHGSGFNQNTPIFFGQFKQLKIDNNEKNPHMHNLFRGDEPTWKDALDEKIAHTSSVSSVLSHIASNISNAKRNIIYIEGQAGSGKTAALLNIAHNLVRSRNEVFLFRKEEHLDVDSCINYIKKQPKSTFILVDGIADYTDEFSHLVSECEKQDILVNIIYTERTSRHSRVQNSYLYQSTPRVFNINKISDLDATRVLDKLKQFDSLGRLTPLTKKERLQHFTKKAQYQMFVAMYTIDFAQGFRNKLESEYTEIDDSSKDLYNFTNIVNSLGYQLPLDIAQRLTGLNNTNILKQIKTGGELYGVLNTDHAGLKSRHRILSSQVVEHLIPKPESVEYIKRLLSAYSIYVTKHSIGTKNIYSLTFKSLMDASVLKDWVGEGAIEIYDHLSTFYGWSARFWEQRALLMNALNYYGPALDYAHKAVDIKQDSFTYNTLGTITLSKAVYLCQAGEFQTSLELAMEGIEYLRKSRDDYDYNNRHPYTTFFTKAIELSKYSPILLEAISQTFHEWVYKSKRSDLISKEEIGTYSRDFGRLEAKQRRFERS